jgi:meiotically up-regulated gene 157 (Mug157) protein
MNIKVTLATKISVHPHYKISGDIPARSIELTSASVRHYLNKARKKGSLTAACAACFWRAPR